MLVLAVMSRLTDAALSISPQRHGLTSTTTRTGHAELVFAKAVPTAQSITRLLGDDPDGAAPDACGIASLTRDLIETFDMLHYLCLERVTKSERAFRYSLYSHHHCCELSKIRDSIGRPDHGPFSQMGRRYAQSQLAADPVFATLSAKQQQSLLAGRSATHRLGHGRASDHPVPAPVALGVYKMLSNAVHATSLGTMGAWSHRGRSLPIAIDLLSMSLQAAVQYLALIISGYIRVRPILRQQLPSESQGLIQQVISRDFSAVVAGTWRT